MRCLRDGEVQAVIDGEASEAHQGHAGSCLRCRDRVEHRRRDMTALISLMSVDGDTSPERQARMWHAIGLGRLAWAAASSRLAGSSASTRWLGSQSIFGHGDERKMGRAMMGSMLFHSLVLALIVAAGVHRIVIDQKQPPLKFDAVFLQQKGPGGGGGGSPHPAAPRKLEVPQPKAVEPVPTPEPPPIPTLNAPVVTNLAQTLQATGSSLAALSAVGGGGTGAGIGPGRGNGLGIGEGGGTGGGVYEIGHGVTAPVPIWTQDPGYTSDAMRAKVQGEVHLEAVVQSNGLLTDIKVIKSLDRVYGLDLAAVDAARRWRFRPGMRAGEAVPVRVQLILEFRLH